MTGQPVTSQPSETDHGGYGVEKLFGDLGPPFQIDDDQVPNRSRDDRAFLRDRDRKSARDFGCDLRQPFDGDARAEAD